MVRYSSWVRLVVLLFVRRRYNLLRQLTLANSPFVGFLPPKEARQAASSAALLGAVSQRESQGSTCSASMGRLMK
jgi:hypothetical protein